MNDEKLYNPKEAQVFRNVRSNIHYVDLFIISLFACPSFTRGIKKYIEKRLNITILQKIINYELNNKDEQILLVLFEIINNYGPFKYYEFVFLLFYIIYQKARLLSRMYIYKSSNYIKICIKLLFICLVFYYYSKISYSTEEEDYAKTFTHKPYDLYLDDIFDEDYLLDFVGQKSYLHTFPYYTIIYRTFVNFLRDASQFNKKISSISNLFGDITSHFDLQTRLQSPHVYDASKILFVFNSFYGNLHMFKKYKDTDEKYNITFPEFISFRVQVNKKSFTGIKLLQYVLVMMYFTLEDKSFPNDNDNIIARFYENNNEKYFRINDEDIIECDTNEKLLVDVKKITTYTPSFYNKCNNIENFDKYIIMCIYHAYKWLE